MLLLQACLPAKSNFKEMSCFYESFWDTLSLSFFLYGFLLQVAFLFQLIEKHPADAMSTGRSTALVLL